MQNKINQFNKTYQRHGYWERYWDGGILWFRCHYVHGRLSGFGDAYTQTGELKYKVYYAR